MRLTMLLKKSKWLVLLLLPLCFVACNNDDEMEPDPVPMSIVEIASADAQFSTLVAALTQANLVTTLEGDGPFTVFAPTNAAFTAAGIDLGTISDEALTEVLLYHVLGAKVTSGDLADGQTYTTTASTNADMDQYSMLIEKEAGNVTLNGTINVTTADVDATNGVIHIVDAVLMPLDIVGHATANPSTFSSLVATLGAASGDLVNVLSGAGPFTVMAPTNAAFAAISSTTDMLDADQLATVLTYHVASGNVRAGDLTDGLAVTTVNGETFVVNIATDGSVTITDNMGGTSSVVLTNVQGTNGVIHVVGSVLLPETI